MATANTDPQIFRYLGFFQRLLTPLVGGTVVSFVAWLFSIGPPWPEPLTVLGCTNVALVLGFFFPYGLRKRRNALEARKLVLFSGMALMILFAIFFVAREAFSCEPFKPGERVVCGFVLRPAIKLVLAENPQLTEFELLQGTHRGNAAEIWQEWSISVVELGVFFMWLAACFSLGVFLTNILLREKLPSTRTQPSS